MAESTRICIFCKHFYFDGGEHGYSEMTPGSAMCLSCNKSHWDLDIGDNYGDYVRAMLTAATCSNFELVDFAAMGIVLPELSTPPASCLMSE